MKKNTMVFAILALIFVGFVLPMSVSCSNAISVYKVSFDSQGGSDVTALDVAKGMKLNEPISAIREGYIFQGWYKESECTNKWSFGTNVVVSNTTLYAKWADDIYSVIYNSNEATGGAAPASQTKTYGIDLTLATNTGDLVRTGYTFGGWNTQMNGWGTDYATGISYIDNVEATLYAKWTKDSYSVIYNANESTGGAVPLSQTKIYEIDLTVVANTGNLVRTGHSFQGWNTQADGLGSDYAAGYAYTLNAVVTLYAKWTADIYSVIFETNGATGGAAPSSQMTTYGIDLDLATNAGDLVRTGYTFGGWNTQADGYGTDYEAGTSCAVNATVTLYAKWIADTYLVTYDANNATGGTTPSSQMKTYSTDLTLAGNLGGLVRTGYTFSGWNTQVNGSGFDYAVEYAYALNAAVTLYAKWIANSYLVTFDSDGGSIPNPRTKIVTYGQPYGNLPNMDDSYDVFMGWWTQPNGKGNRVYDTTIVNTASNHTLYAKWTQGWW